jgi:hypothetical protein
MPDASPNTSAPEPRRWSRKTTWLFLTLIGSIGLSLAAKRVVGQQNTELLGYAVILVGSILGIAIVRSMTRKGLLASIIGGASGCATLVGFSIFIEVLFISPEPGTRYKFGDGIDAAMIGLLLGLFLGGIWGAVAGLIAGLLRKIP